LGICANHHRFDLRPSNIEFSESGNKGLESDGFEFWRTIFNLIGYGIDDEGILDFSFQRKCQIFVEKPLRNIWILWYFELSLAGTLFA